MNEEEFRRALLTELQEPAPAPRTSLPEVLELGRRRVRRTWLATGAAALSVVAVVVGAMTISPLSVSAPEPADGPAMTTTRVPAAPEWPRVNVPARTPRGTWQPGKTAPPPADRPIPPIPRCDIDPLAPEDEPTRYAGSVHLTGGQVASFHQAVVDLLPELKVSEARTHVMPHNPEKGQTLDAHTYWMDVADEGGTGSVWLNVGEFEGTPVEMADKVIWSTGDCTPPYRKTTPDGTVVQIHGVQALEPFQSLVQTAQVFRPDRKFFRLEMTNYGSPDLRPDPKQPEMWERIGAGRGSVPFAVQQLGAIALTLTEL